MSVADSIDQLILQRITEVVTPDFIRGLAAGVLLGGGGTGGGSGGGGTNPPIDLSGYLLIRDFMDHVDNVPSTTLAGHTLIDGETIGINESNQLYVLNPGLNQDDADARYLQEASNLADVDDPAVARTNLGAAAQTALDAHTSNTSNPHAVTASQVGNGTAQWNASQLRGIAISTTAPTASTSLLRYNSTTSQYEPVTIGQLKIPRAPAGWYFDGSITVANDQGPNYPIDVNCTLLNVALRCKTAPAGSALDIDIRVKRSGVWTSLFSTRPTIAAGATSGGSGAVFAITTLDANEELRCDVIASGTTAAQGVTVQLRMETR